jgi:hypothetical protein
VFSASTALPYGLAGALLLELYLLERIDFRGKKIKVINSSKTHNDILDEALELISGSTRLHDTKHWLQTIYSKVNKIQERLAEQLVSKKVLEKEEHSFLWVFNYNRYPTSDAKPEKDVRSHVRDIVLKRQQASEEDVALISLIKACDLVNEVFEKAERSKASKRIEEISKNQKIGAAISQTMDEIMAAIMVIIMASTVTTTIVS